MVRVSFIILALVLIGIAGCSEADKIEEEIFVDVYTELAFAHDSLGTDNEKFREKKEEIFTRYDVTDSNYDATLEYYSDDPERWKNFFDKVLERMEAMKKKGGN